MEKVIKAKGLIEQHIHGAYGVDFTVAKADEIVYLAEKLYQDGISVFFPTLVTDSICNIKKQIAEIKRAKEIQPINSARIEGIHLEGPFINPEKKGIHDVSLIQKPSIEVFKEIEDEIIKIVTIAPELDENKNLTKYLYNKGIKVSIGHSTSTDFAFAHQATHLFNAMEGISHRKKTTATEALINDNVYTEVIADSIHICNEVLELIFRIKPKNKILLISDALPIAHSDKASMTFCSEQIYLQEGKATNAEGTIAGSAMLLPDIIKNIVKNDLLLLEDAVNMASTNISDYHGIENPVNITLSSDGSIVEVSRV